MLAKELVIGWLFVGGLLALVFMYAVLLVIARGRRGENLTSIKSWRLGITNITNEGPHLQFLREGAGRIRVQEWHSRSLHAGNKGPIESRRSCPR